jgi:hypothetical protein
MYAFRVMFSVLTTSAYVSRCTCIMHAADRRPTNVSVTSQYNESSLITALNVDHDATAHIFTAMLE